MGNQAGRKKRSRTRESGREKKMEGAGPALLGSGDALRLNVVVVTAGAVLMGLEIVGSRLLAPHFGNSVFVWGSLISVFLAALSGGYFVGGRMADARPTFGRLYSICLFTALLIFLIPVVAHPLCRKMLDLGFREQSGPLVAATILFLPPSFLLGMVSPFAVRLAARSVQAVGRAAGTLYALSTLGSIAGTLLTTFVLIPNLGVVWIFKGLGVVMAVLPIAAALSALRPGAWMFLGLIMAIGGAALPAAGSTSRSQLAEVLVEEDTAYHHVAVIDRPDLNQRQMMFDRYVESAIEISPPYKSRSGYTSYFHLAFLMKRDIGSALFIGAGGGIGPRTFAQMNPSMRIDVVDIDPRVLELAEEHFHMPVTERIRPIARDGRIFVRQTEETYDAIILDAFTIGGRIPFHLATREFFEMCRSRLAPDGVFMMNLNSALEGENGRIFHSVARTLEEVFPNLYVFAKDIRVYRTMDVSRNILLATGPDPARIPPAEWTARAERYPDRSIVRRERVREMVRDLLEDVPDLSGARPFTDDFAPIETMRF